jgi:hypothetical protein
MAPMPTTNGRTNNVKFFLFVLWGFFFETAFHYVTLAGFKLKIILPEFLECWDYRRTPPPLVSKIILVVFDI